MACVLPVFIALIINSIGYNVFLTPIHYPTSPYLSGLLFALAVYFIILSCNLYPERLRRLPNVIIRIYEFFGSLFLFEFTNSLGWFPLETFTFITLMRTATFLKILISPSNILYCVIYHLICFLQHYKTGILFSYILSLMTLTISLHATYTADFDLLRHAGVRCFIRDLSAGFKAGIKCTLSIERKSKSSGRKIRRRPKKSACRKC